MSDNSMSDEFRQLPDSEYVDRCLSMVLHHKEVQIIADVVKSVLEEYASGGESTDKVSS